MSDTQKNSDTGKGLPRAKTKQRKWKFPIVWVVPLLAAIVAGYLVYQRVREFGPTITIHFKDVTGLKVGQTSIQYRGVSIGEVTAVELSKDQKYAIVKAHLKRSDISVAREGAIFWIVRPEVGIANITGLGTILAGPHIEVLPGSGEGKFEFVGLENRPVSLESKGLEIVLRATQRGSLSAGSPVYYRGIEVGTVRDCQLGTNAVTVDIRVFIRERYANLVRSGSKFWNVSGMDVQFGLFSGLDVNMESMRSLMTGGIAFATPEDLVVEPVNDGTVFELHNEADKTWLKWSPEIPVPPEK